MKNWYSDKQCSYSNAQLQRGRESRQTEAGNNPGQSADGCHYTAPAQCHCLRPTFVFFERLSCNAPATRMPEKPAFPASAVTFWADKLPQRDQRWKSQTDTPSTN